MIKKLQPGLFFHRLYDKKIHFPYTGQIELTYRCDLDCVHCYCKGLKLKELTAGEWKKILDQLKEEGCLNLTFTGGEPLLRKDFLEIYSYAKTKGFLITIFSNGQFFTPKVIDYFVKSPPLCIEITLNGITPKTYESITKIPGSFAKVMRAIYALKEKGIPFILKANCLKQNRHEIGQIKAFTEKLFDQLPRKRYRFKYDPLIFPRFNGDKTPCKYRPSFEELSEIRKQDLDIWKEYQQGLHSSSPDLKWEKDALYKCNSWQQNFFINPSGRLRFCHFSDKFSVDLKTDSFKKGFYYVFPQLLNEKFKTHSKCRNCKLRSSCYYCPARAYLETGDEEAPVPYYCTLAKATYRERKNPTVLQRSK